MRMSYEDAKEHLRTREALSKDGGLFNMGWYLGWTPGDELATLDGQFTLQDLQAIFVYMRDYE